MLSRRVWHGWCGSIRSTTAKRGNDHLTVPRIRRRSGGAARELARRPRRLLLLRTPKRAARVRAKAPVLVETTTGEDVVDPPNADTGR
jgi:hypothetical protein